MLLFYTHLLFLPSAPHSRFFFHDTATTEIYTLSLHDALPISVLSRPVPLRVDASTGAAAQACGRGRRSEEHTSELQSRVDLVCRLLLEKKNNDADHSLLGIRRQHPTDRQKNASKRQRHSPLRE